MRPEIDAVGSGRLEPTRVLIFTTAMEGYTESQEAERDMATSNVRLTIRRADDGLNWQVQGMDRKEVQAKANQLIETLRPYSTL